MMGLSFTERFMSIIENGKELVEERGMVCGREAQVGRGKLYMSLAGYAPRCTLYCLTAEGQIMAMVPMMMIRMPISGSDCRLWHRRHAELKYPGHLPQIENVGVVRALPATSFENI